MVPADTIMWEVALSRCDGNRNILHAAVMNAFAATNREDEDTVDVAIDFDKKITPSETARKHHSSRSFLHCFSRIYASVDAFVNAFILHVDIKVSC